MKVLHLQLTGNPGGIVCLCRDIASNSENENIMYFLFEGGTVADDIKQNGYQVEVANAPRKIWIQSAKKFINYCANNKIDVVINHSNSPIAIFHIACLKKVNPTIKWIMYFHSAAEDLFSTVKRRVLYWPFIKYQIRHADKRIAISKFVRKSCSDMFKIALDDIEVVYNGVDCKKFELHNNQSDTIELIYVGRLIESKGVSKLIEAMSLLDKNLKVHLSIVGNGPQQSELYALANRLCLDNKITFLGSRIEIAEELKKADFFVHPAIWNEGFGITLIEAMSAGLPCIAFNVGAIPEIINDGVNGFIVSDINSDSLSKTILDCIELKYTHKYQELSSNAFETARRFDIANMVDSLERFY